MEIKTCEQYVLAQLFDQQDENDMLNRELKYRDERIDELAGQMKTIEAVHDSPMQEAIRKAGRDALMSHCTGYACEVTDGETFEDWCLENVRKYYLPEGISVLAFIKEFEPELRAKYDKQAAERANDTHLRALALPELRKRIPAGHRNRHHGHRRRGAFHRRGPDRRQLPVLRTAGRRNRARPAGPVPRLRGVGL